MTVERSFSLIHRTTPAGKGLPPYPGLLLLHGRGANELDLLSIGAAIDPRLFIVSARAPFELGPAAFYWYDLEGALVGRPSSETIEVSLDLIKAFIPEMLEAYSIDPGRLYIAGFSQGGAMAAATALVEPERVAGALIFSGYLPVHSDLPFKPDLAKFPIFQAHGTFDEVLPIEYGRMTRDYLVQSAAALLYREYPIGHSIIPEELFDAGEWIRESLVQESG